MKQKKKVIISFSFIAAVLFFLPIFAFCETKESNDAPEWMKRINFGAELGTDQKPYFYFETVQPLYQDIDKLSTVFIQPRISMHEERPAYNLGIGYRKLLSENTIMLGTNMFFDYEADHDHYRTGLGLEAFVNLIECRVNSYIGLSPRRLVHEVGIMREYEKAVDGFDWEFGLPIPFMNWIKLFGGGYWYNYEKFKNKEGWQVRTEIKPFKFTTLNFITFDDNKGDMEYRVDARVNLPFGTGGKNEEKICNIGLSKTAYSEKVDHSNRVLDRVERQYKIEVERWTENAGAVVEIKRGN